MKGNVRLPVLAYRHPERSRGIFLERGKTIHMRKSVIPSRMEYGVSRSPHIFCLTGMQGRFLDFARNDNKGKALLSFSACLRRISSLSFIPRAPYPPLWGTFPSRGRLFMTNGEAPLHFSFERASTGNHGLRRPWFPTISSPNMRPLSPLRPCRGRS